MKKFFQEFKTFAIKGNVIDLAVGVMIGTAFSKIVSSLVNDLLMPVLSLIIGKISIADLSVTITSRIGQNPIIIQYGSFLQNIIDFLIIAFSIFVALKFINKIMKKENNKKEVTKIPELTKDQLLLTEIRDLLKKQ
jgi:large conductance mechanosensitive channel